MSHADDIENQAATWLAKRDTLGDRAEMPEFTAWLAADPRHRAAYLRLAAAWERTAQLKRLAPDATVPDADLLRPGGAARSVRFWLWRPPLALAAGLVAVAAMAALWWVGLHTGGEIYRTEIGGLSRVVLKDGSAVTLNTDTELRVHFTAARREVELTRGEAQFNVAQDTARPFEVLAGGRVVRAVGTAFDVRLDHGELMEVMVTEGHVALVDATDQVPANTAATPVTTLAAGESAVAQGAEVRVRRIAATEVSRRLAWESGELSFQGETLLQAVSEFNRYNRRKLKVDDASIEDLAIGGNFQALDVDSFVAALDRSFGIHAKTAEDGTVMLTRTAVRSE